MRRKSPHSGGSPIRTPSVRYQIALALALTSQDETRAQQAVTRVLSLPERAGR